MWGAPSARPGLDMGGGRPVDRQLRQSIPLPPFPLSPPSPSRWTPSPARGQGGPGLSACYTACPHVSILYGQGSAEGPALMDLGERWAPLCYQHYPACIWRGGAVRPGPGPSMAGARHAGPSPRGAAPTCGPR